MSNATARKLLDRLVALNDHIDDIEQLLPTSPYSMSASQLKIAMLCAHVRNELPKLIGDVRQVVR